MDVFDSQLKKHPMAYINYLQQQNRAKKQSELQDKEKLINKQKEEAFNIYLQGANEERVESLRKKEKISKLREKSIGVNARKKWGSTSSNRSRPSMAKLNPNPSSFNESSIHSTSHMDLRSYDNYEEHLDKIKEIIENFTEKQLNCVLTYLDNIIPK